MHWVDSILQSSRIKWFLGLIALYLCYQVWRNYETFGMYWACWDLMMISGFLTFILAVWLAADLSRRLNLAIDQLRLNNVLVIDDAGVQRLKEDISNRGLSVQVWSGVLITLVTFGSYWAAFGPYATRVWNVWQAGQHPEAGKILLQIGSFTLVSAIGAALAGMLFGRLTHYGRLAGVLGKSENSLRIIPSHSDGACGLKPIGDYYLYQALVFAVPIIWLGAWWAWIIPNYDGMVCTLTGQSLQRYSNWQQPFFIQWLVVLAYFYMGFVWPFLILRRRIKEARKSYNEHEATRLRSDIIALQNQLSDLTEAEAAQDRHAVLTVLDAKSKELWSIQNMSGWPMDTGTLAKYRSLLVGEVALPVIAALISASNKEDGSIWQYLGTWLRKLI
ncbi:MAG: hypothetical protein ACI89J_004633 [Hyphomicrobiaceae bacterium]|jgi:hypothetical protein